MVVTEERGACARTEEEKPQEDDFGSFFAFIF